MKKIFTLISMAFVAMSVNAQTEEYLAVDDEKNFSPEFSAVVDPATNNATNSVNGMSTVTFGTTNVSVTAVSNGTPNELTTEMGYNGTETFDNTNWPSWSDPQWKLFNKNKRIWHRGENDEVVDDFYFYGIQGTGNPTTGFVGEKVLDGEDFLKWRAKFDGYYFEPGVSTAVPASGEYFTFKANVDGMFKIGFTCPNGASRYMYIVEKSTVRTFAKSEYKVEGYVNGKDNADGSPAWQASIQVNDNYSIGNAEGTTWKDGEEKAFNELNQPKFGWFVFDAKAGEEYYIFMPNTQFGFRNYEFTPGAKIDDYTPTDPTNPTGIKTIKSAYDVNASAARYNLSGQKVSDSYKGVVVKNGRKFMQN